MEVSLKSDTLSKENQEIINETKTLGIETKVYHTESQKTIKDLVDSNKDLNNQVYGMASSVIGNRRTLIEKGFIFLGQLVAGGTGLYFLLEFLTNR